MKINSQYKIKKVDEITEKSKQNNKQQKKNQYQKENKDKDTDTFAQILDNEKNNYKEKTKSYSKKLF